MVRKEGVTITSDINSPFNWHLRKEPSIFAKDPAFTPRKDGKSNSEVQTEVVERRKARGENPGTIHNLGKQSADKEQQILAYRQFGTYTRAKPSVKVPNKHEK